MSTFYMVLLESFIALSCYENFFLTTKKLYLTFLFYIGLIPACSFEYIVFVSVDTIISVSTNNMDGKVAIGVNCDIHIEWPK